uniref:Metallo-beta-lactamase domain-containing protein n=1 Tax=Erythrolobus australicus TaxID=1077150 RepID=A0A7S1TL41_9RHOD|mmetsp:Transcript_3423/g.9389  ORF Transcript_3423/g.9389 Transcript_3423/m.9389 type:complete len:370 (+) Transcript_3423:42-1151(+)
MRGAGARMELAWQSALVPRAMRAKRRGCGADCGRSVGGGGARHGARRCAARVQAEVRCAAGGGRGDSRRRLKHNAEGALFVDARCIDCDTCRWMAPQTFVRREGQSSVGHQPTKEHERMAAYRAASACPTGSIRLEPPRTEIQAAELRKAADSFPFAFAPDVLPNVFHLGAADRQSFAACAYLVARLESPAYMVDVPRFSRALASRVVKASAGSAPKWMILTHQDDVGSHARWAAELEGVTRVMHADDASRRAGTTECELLLRGGGPWELADGVEIIAVPGHTRGSIAVLDHRAQALFTGDHIAYSARAQGLSCFKAYNWYSWEEQLRSVEKLLDVPFLHILPGHGRAHHFQSNEDRRTALTALLAQVR